MILVLMLIMVIMPKGVHAGTYEAKDWDEYKEKLKIAIMNQDGDIVIKFNGNEFFSTEYFARLKIANMYEEALKDIPKYLGKLNILGQSTIPELDGVLNAKLKKVTHRTEYKNSEKDFKDVKSIISKEYDSIKSQVTDYEKLKTVYDYIVIELKNTDGELFKLLSPPEGETYETYPHAVLFALMMSEIGYENDIAIGDNGHIWNLVKVHGEWYHVDAGRENINVENKVGDEFFLIAIVDQGWNKDDHGDKTFAKKNYNGNPSTVPQIEYEITLIDKGMPKEADVNNIPDVLSIDDVKDTKEKVKQLEIKIADYLERIVLLKGEVDKLGQVEQKQSLITALGDLENNLKWVSDKLNSKKQTIVNNAVTKAKNTFDLNDISIAKGLSDMLTDSATKEKMIVLENSILAIEKAEKTKSTSDINLAKESTTNITEDLKTRLDERIRVLEAIIAVEEAEKTMDDGNIEIANGLISGLKDGEAKNNLNARLTAVRDKKDTNETEQGNIGRAELAVITAEEIIKTSSDIDEIETKIISADDAIKLVKTESIKTQLQARIDEVVTTKDAIKLVNDAESSLDNVHYKGSLSTIIKESEEKFKNAEAAIKDIKDKDAKTNQQNRMKMIKVVITALKAVEKAETTPFKISNVNSAKSAIAKLDDNFATIITTLTGRLKIVEKDISNSNIIAKALAAVEKAEKSIRSTDIALAKEAIELLKLQQKGEEFKTVIDELNLRMTSTESMLKMENDLIKYLKDFTEGNKEILKAALIDIKTSFDNIPDGEIKTLRRARVIVIDNIMLVCGKIETAIEQPTDVNIKVAEDAIDSITDSKVKKELENKLKNLLAEKEIDKKIKEANDAVSNARNSLIDENTTSKDNRAVVELANESVNKLPTGNIKKQLQDKIKEFNNAIKAKQTVENAEVKQKNGTLTEKDVIAAEKSILNINPDYKEGLDHRVRELRKALETNEAAELLKKAKEAVEKAEETEMAKDIIAAKKAVSQVKDNVEKANLTEEIEELEVKIAKKAVVNMEESAYENRKSISKDITTTKTTVTAISSKYKAEKENLNARIKAIESYMATIKVLENAEKTMNEENKNAVKIMLEKFKVDVEGVSIGDKTIYNEMIEDIGKRIKYIEIHLETEAGKESDAEKAVEYAEKEMTVAEDPSNSLIQEAQTAVNKVTDKNLKAKLQKRIDAIQVAKDAKVAVAKAKAYPNEKSIKDAETALGKVDGRYGDIIEYLSEEIAKLRHQLDISRKVTEATNLVQKAVTSRISADSIKARFAVEGIKELAKDSYDRLIIILNNLDDSIKNEATDEAGALKTANDALVEAFKIIGEANTFIVKIIEGKDEEANIKEAYRMIESAKNQVIIANAAVRKLSNQKELLKEIEYSNKEIELAEDNIDVKEAVRLVTIGSSSVMNATTDEAKSKARLDIAAARRAIDKIGHNDNKAIKVTILNTINSIEKKLTSDNDQELIDLAVIAVNEAASMLSGAVRDNTIKDKNEQEKIDRAIFSARMAIGWISDNNKAAKDTLTSFLNDIAAMFAAEKDGILNEDRIANAEKAVKLAEDNKNSDLLENYIRSARLRVKMINNDGPETEVIINDLNTRLDILEGKGGSGGNNGSGGNKPSNGGNKPGGSGGTTPGNKIPTSPLPDKDRLTGSTKPIWGKTNELNKKNPITNLSNQDITAFRIYESKLKIIELSNILKTVQSTNVRLVVRGKNIALDSKPYIHDKVNNSILVPIKYLGDELGFSVSLIDSPITKGAKRLLLNGIVDGKPKSIIMDLGSEFCYVNGNLVKIISKPVINVGRTYIPIDLMVEHFGLTFSYYNEGKSIQLIIN